MAKLTVAEKAQKAKEKLAQKMRAMRSRRDKKIQALYAKIDRKTKKKIHSIRSLAKVFELSKSRIHEIVSGY